MVYVGKREYRYKGMVMSHMVADSLEELHQIAELLGIRKYFQNKENKPHYDVCRAYKIKAINLGAKEIDDRDIVRILRGERNLERSVATMPH